MAFELWAVMEQANAWPFLFWDQTEYEKTPVPICGDPADFVKFMADKQFLIFQSRETGEIAGCIWFDKIKKGQSAFGSIWMLPKFRGQPSREAVRIGMEYGFYAMGWPTIWALTPWPIARNLIKHCGFEDVVVIPGLYVVGDRPADVYLLKAEETNYGR